MYKDCTFSRMSKYLVYININKSLLDALDNKLQFTIIHYNFRIYHAMLYVCKTKYQKGKKIIRITEIIS